MWLSRQSHLHVGARCSSSSSSSSSRLQVLPQLHRIPAAQRPLGSRRVRAISGQPQQPDRQQQGPEDRQQQELREFEQQQEQQQQPLAGQAAEAQATAAMRAATAIESATAASTSAADEDRIMAEWQQQQQEWEQEDQKWRQTSRNVYFLMALGLTAAGLLVAVTAAPIAAAGLKLGVGLQVPQAAVLVGCLGAAVLRAASLAWFLAEGAAVGELGSWRYQRVNLGLAAAAAAAALAAATAGWAGAQPWLLLLLVGGCGATAAACLGLAVGQLQRGDFYFASALGYGDFFEGCSATVGYLLYNVTCLAGALMTGMAVVGLGLGVAAVSGSAVLPVLPWIAPGSSGVAAATLLHKLLGAGLLLLAVQAWALTEYAANGRDVAPETAVKLMYARTAEEYAVETGELGPAPVHAPLRRFDLLHAGFIASAVAQGLWLAQAAAAGPGLGLLNAGDPLWGSLFWAVMGSGLYLLILLTSMDFGDVTASFFRVVDWAGGLVSLGAAVLFVDWMWLTPVVRR